MRASNVELRRVRSRAKVLTISQNITRTSDRNVGICRKSVKSDTWGDRLRIRKNSRYNIRLSSYCHDSAATTEWAGCQSDHSTRFRDPSAGFTGCAPNPRWNGTIESTKAITKQGQRVRTRSGSVWKCNGT